MPETATKVETLDLRFRAPKQTSGKWLPGGVWLWFFMGASIGIGAWIFGRRELMVRLAAQVSANNAASASLFAIEALESLDANTIDHLVVGLHHPDPRVARAAHQKINSHIDHWGSTDVAVQYAAMKSLAVQLQKIPPGLPEPNLMLVRSIAARLFASSVSIDDPQVKPVTEICQQLLARVTEPSGSGNSATNEAQQVPPAPLPALTTSAPESIIPSENKPIHRSSSTPVASLRLVAGPTRSRTVETSAVESKMPSLQVNNNLANEPESLAVGSPSAVRPSAVTNTTHSREDSSDPEALHLVPNKPDLPVVVATPASISSHPIAKLKVVSTQPDLAGIEKLQIAELIRLLAHENSDVAKAAALGLRNQGMSDAKIELASELAMGSASRRLELIQRVATSGDMDPRPWLVWMGEDGEPEVRKMAISLLIPLADENVYRSLRNLAARESDNHIKELITRALISASK